jgi:bifunctional ADP-heptose synthase (sugar kinase/adenylyltransferase)
MLTDALVEQILERIPRLSLGVLGDLFLDRYLDIDAALTEPSIETGLDAYQVVRVRPNPGAAGTVINNLVALGVREVRAIAVIGDDGEGYELLQALRRLGVVDTAGVVVSADRRTPTYTKPMLQEPGRQARELNRLDIKNRTPLPGPLEERVLALLRDLWPRVDALLVLDQVSEADCGVVTTRVRDLLARLGESDSGRFVLADSRERIGLFRSVCLKPNVRECRRAIYGQDTDRDAPNPVWELAERAGRPVFCTAGELGILLADPGTVAGRVTQVSAFPVHGPIDPVGAGDSTSAGIASALAAGAALEAAAAFGNLVASITVHQIGTTGTASPEQVRQRWREVRGGS